MIYDVHCKLDVNPMDTKGPRMCSDSSLQPLKEEMCGTLGDRMHEEKINFPKKGMQISSLILMTSSKATRQTAAASHATNEAQPAGRPVAALGVADVGDAEEVTWGGDNDSMGPAREGRKARREADRATSASAARVSWPSTWCTAAMEVGGLVPARKKPRDGGTGREGEGEGSWDDRRLSAVGHAHSAALSSKARQTSAQ